MLRDGLREVKSVAEDHRAGDDKSGKEREGQNAI
jgi:hypothetical protein